MSMADEVEKIHREEAIPTPLTDELLHLLIGVFSEKQFPSIVAHAKCMEADRAELIAALQRIQHMAETGEPNISVVARNMLQRIKGGK